ncbi:MAG: hypothetical protein F7C34_03430 [Desulfurococcales archaeon]|nr:hypothetical protein [Desulfurococcales archaeon]
MREDEGIRIVRAPPPSPETGYELVYKFEVEGQRKRWRMNPNPPGEKMSLIELLKTPGLNIIVASIIGGLAVLGYVLYLYFSMR